MAGIPLYFASGSGGNASFTRLSTFVTFSTLPATDTTLVDANGATVGYFRLKWSPTNKFVAEAAYRGSAFSLNLCPSFTVLTNTWYWVSMVAGSVAGVGQEFYGLGQVWGPGGVSPGGVSGSGSPAPPNQSAESASCALGWGVSLSSGYAAFPNAPGQAMAELVVETGHGTQNVTDANNAGVRGAPAGALSPGGYIVALYHPSDTIGTAVTVHDATTNHYDLLPGGQGNAIVASGPF